MIKPKCIVCSSQENVVFKFSAKANLYDKDNSYKYWHCNNCVVLFRDPMLDDIINSYDSKYYSFQQISLIEIVKNYLSSFLYNIFYYIGLDFKKNDYVLWNIFKKLKLKKNVRILDVGCGGGQFLLRLSSFGYKNIFGFDPNFNDKFQKFPIFNKNLENLDGNYDFINVHHVIEHVKMPIDFLTDIKRLLSTNGIAVITFPKYGRVVEVDREFSYLVQAPDHIALYSETSFEKLCSKVKLRIVEKVIDSSGTFNWLILGALWKKRIYVKSYNKKFLSYLDDLEIYNIKKITKEIIKNKQGSNALYILEKHE